MKAHLTVDVNEVKKALDRLRAANKTEAYTSDIIREYMGGFLSNRGVPVHLSWNAQFGRLISQHAKALRIEERQSDCPIEDDLKHPTTSSLWRI